MHLAADFPRANSQMLRSTLLLVLAAAASAFTVPTARVARSSVTMMASGKANNTPAKYAPKGAFGGYALPGDGSTGWIGDRSKSLQIGKFEKGEDYLFFQGPAPKTAVQEDLPDFFSLDNFSDLKVKPLQILTTGTGFGALAVLGYLLVA